MPRCDPNFLQQLQSLYGNPGSVGTLEDAFNKLTTAVQALSTSADSQSARIGVINAANVLASQLNSMTQGIQTLRGAAENGISDSVNTANNLMSQIATINNQLAANPLGGTSTDASTAALLDQRDQYITQLSELMDIRVTTNGSNQVTVFTSSGVQLVGNEAARLSFNAQGTVSPNTQWNSDPSKSNLGSVVVSFVNGGSIDLTATGGIKSGKIAAYTELRDKSLVEAQNQLDQFAASLSSALSDKTTAGTAVTSGLQSGFDLNVADLKAGNVIHVTYTDTATNTQRQVSIMRVDDASVLPLSNDATADPNDQVVGVDFSGGMASVIAQLNTALGGSNLQFSGSGSTLTVLNNTGFSTVNAASVTTTQTNLTNGSAELSLFTDNGITLHRRDRCDGFADHGPGGTSCRQQCAGRGSLQACALQRFDGRGRHDAFRLHPVAADHGKVSIFAGIGCRQRQRAVQRHAAELHAAVHQRAGCGRRRGSATRRRAGRGAQYAAGKDVSDLGRQHRRGDGASAVAAELLFGQRARDVDRERNVQNVDAGNMRQS